MWTDLRVLRNFQTGLSSEAMSAIGTKRTCASALRMSAFGGKADVASTSQNVRLSSASTGFVSKAKSASRGRWCVGRAAGYAGSGQRLPARLRRSDHCHALRSEIFDIAATCCFTSAQKDTGGYGPIRSWLVKHFACKISAISLNDWNVRFWRKADMAECTVRFRSKADMMFCSAHVR